MCRMDSRLTVSAVETLQSRVPETFDHLYIVSIRYTKVKEFRSERLIPRLDSVARYRTRLHAGRSYEFLTPISNCPIYT